MPVRATDDFTGSSGPLSGAWTQQRTATIDRTGSGRAIGTGNAAVFWNEIVSFDGQSTIVPKVLGASDFASVSVRAKDVGNSNYDCYQFNLNGGGFDIHISKVIDGSEVLVANLGAIGWAVDEAATIAVRGGTITVFRNGTSVGSGTDASLTSGSPGFVANSATCEFDDWEGLNLDPQVGIVGTKRLPRSRGPRDRRGFLRKRIWHVDATVTSYISLDAIGQSAIGTVDIEQVFDVAIIAAGQSAFSGDAPGEDAGDIALEEVFEVSLGAVGQSASGAVTAEQIFDVVADGVAATGIASVEMDTDSIPPPEPPPETEEFVPSIRSVDFERSFIVSPTPRPKYPKKQSYESVIEAIGRQGTASVIVTTQSPTDMAAVVLGRSAFAASTWESQENEEEMFEHVLALLT